MLLPFVSRESWCYDIGVQISFRVLASILIGIYIPTTRISVSEIVFFFNFLKNHHSVFHSSCTKVPISPLLAYTSFFFF